MTNSKSAKIKAQEMGLVDPMFWVNKGRAGGKVSGIKKGFSAMSEEKRKEIQAKGLAARKAKRDEQAK